MNELGPTGEYPKGKLTEGDDGQLKLAIGTYKNNVILDFGVKISWIGMEKEDALNLADAIIKQANTL